MSMELKIICPCGQKYKFDVEPVNGRMPFPVNCPVCNQDGTIKANEMLAQQLAVPPPPPRSPIVPTITPMAPAPVSSAPPPPPIAPISAGLKINRAAHPAPAAAPETAAASETPTSAAPAIGALRPFAVGAAANPPKPKSFRMGLLGGFIGALVGAIVYYLVFKFTGLRIKLLAVGVGALAGWLAELMGKGEGSKELGGITATLVLAGVVGAQYLVALGWWHEGTEARLKEVQSAYANAVVEARVVVKAVPSGSDSEIRQYLAKEGDDSDTKPNPANISGEEVKDFHDNLLPEYQALASGQTTKEQYEQQHQIKIAESKEEADSDEGTFKAIFLLLLISKSNLFSLALAAGTAFKLSTNA